MFSYWYNSTTSDYCEFNSILVPETTADELQHIHNIEKSRLVKVIDRKKVNDSTLTGDWKWAIVITDLNDITTTFINQVKLHSNWSIVIPTVDVDLDMLGGIPVWLYLDVYNKLVLQKFTTYNNLNLIIPPIVDKRMLSILLLNFKDVALTDNCILNDVIATINDIKADYKFHEFIITPLNPLVKDLDIGVYEQFQKDHFKYQQYGNAIELALHDLQLKYHEDPINILIIGPGMGNLVDEVFKLFRPNYNLTIVEKNPKVIPHLHHLNKSQWNSAVTILHNDVRSIKDFKFNLIISEMLGSFGCNELFPEVLAGISSDIMIPASITNFLSPIYSQITTEHPFLNNLKHYYQVNEKFFPCWDFEYPGNNDLTRSIQLQVGIEVNGKINGLMGVFKSVLYGNYEITNIKNSNWCKSWFPMVFPLIESEVFQGDILHIKFSRTSEDNTYYQWEVNGKKYHKYNLN